MGKKRIISIFFIFLVIFTNISFNTTRATEATKIYVWVKTEDERPIANARVWVFEPYEHGGYQEPYLYDFTDSNGLVTQNIFGTHVKYKVELPDGTWFKPKELTDLKEGEERDLYFIADHYPGCADTVVTGEVISVWGGYFDDYLTFTLKIDEVLKHYPESGDTIKKGRETEVVVYIYEKICKEGDRVEVSGRYAFFSDRIEVPIGLCSEMYVKVLTESSSSILGITCNVSGYDLFIDGEYTLTEGSDEPLDGTCEVPIEAGDRIITLEKGGCDSVTQFIKIESGQILYLEFEMECIAPPTSAPTTTPPTTPSKPTEFVIESYEYTSDYGVYTILAKILDFLKIKNIQAGGIFRCKISPSNKVTDVRILLEAKYIRAEDYFNWYVCALPFEELPSSKLKTEKKWISLTKNQDVYSGTVGLSAFTPGSILPSTALKRYGGGNIQLPGMYITGNEPIYTSASITIIEITSIEGKKFSFNINEPVETLYQRINREYENRENLIVEAYCPVDISISDPSGKRIGYQNTKLYDEIENGFYSRRENELQIILISNPDEGEYKIFVEGKDTGEYDLYTCLISKGEIIEQNIYEKRDIISGKTDKYSINVDFSGKKPTSTKTQTPVPTNGITKPPITIPGTLGNKNYLYFGIIIAIIIASIVLVYSRGYMGTRGGGTTDSEDGYISDWDEEETGTSEDEGYISDWEEETTETTEEEGFVGWNEEETTETGEEKGYVGW